MGGKVCSLCKVEKPVAAFSKHRAMKSGLNNWCRPCTVKKVQDYRRRNRQKVLEYTRKQELRWRRANPERAAAKVARRMKRLAEAPGGPFDYSRPDYQTRVAAFGGRCVFCGGPFEVLDHALPLCRGGTNDASNILPACKSCNTSKHTKTPDEFISWRLENKLGHG